MLRIFHIEVKMLTRYLYDCDEVCYALIDSLYRGRSKEAVFWARELLLSKEPAVLDRTVVRAWLLFLGASRINWLDAWFSADSDIVRLALIHEFGPLCKRGRGALPMKMFVMCGRGFSLEQDIDKVQEALNKNDAFSFYWWSGFEKAPSGLLEFVKGYVDDPGIFDSLTRAMGLYTVLSLKSLLAAAAVQVLCMKSYSDTYVAGDLDKDLINVYDGLKVNRAYAIVETMLPCRHVRATQWDVFCKSHKELIRGAGSLFWKDVDSQIVDDESLERITGELFPEDCPDEWSIKDRAISHPDKFSKYKRHLKPSYRCKLLWKFTPVLRAEWSVRIEALFKACSAPEN